MAREPYFPHFAILVPYRKSCACLRGQYALRKIPRHSNHVPAAEQRPRHRRCPTSRDFVPWRFSDAGRHSSWIASSSLVALKVRFGLWQLAAASLIHLDLKFELLIRGRPAVGNKGARETVNAGEHDRRQNHLVAEPIVSEAHPKKAQERPSHHYIVFNDKADVNTTRAATSATSTATICARSGLTVVRPWLCVPKT